jgi:hypothetical protein
MTILGVCLAANPARGDGPLLDFWDQALRVTVAHKASGDPFAQVSARQRPDYKNLAVGLRFDRARFGAFSLELGQSEAPVVTLLSSVWGRVLEVPPDATLEFWLTSDDPKALPESVAVKIFDIGPTSVPTSAQRVQDATEWVRYAVKLPTGLHAEHGATRIRAITLDLSAARGHGPILLDGADFKTRDRFIGFTDKTLNEWMKEAAETRADRIRHAFEIGKGTNFSGAFRQYFDTLWLGQKVVECNAALQTLLKEELDRLDARKADLWDLALNVRLVEAYYALGSRSGRSPSPLDPRTEKLLLEVLWQRTRDKNDIGWASTDTWRMTGSENHDLNAKVANLISSRILMDEPAYRERLYPDAAHAPGYGYWFGPTGNGEAGYGPESPAWWKFSGQHTAAEHYRAWVSFFDRYLTERARRGFFLERAAPGYMKWTLGFLYTLHAYCGQAALQKKTGDFLDLVWADWAQEQIAGIRGGPKTRHHNSVGGEDSMTEMSRFLLGGPGTTIQIYTSLLLDNRPLPDVVFGLALDSRGRGRYAAISRGVGEEEAARAPGTERTLTAGREARFIKYSWVTPDYILGTQMDHPDAVHSHLSAAGRWHGLIVAGSPDTRIVPTGGMVQAANGRPYPDMELVYQTAQDRNVLIVQQARRWLQVNPRWFPAGPAYEKPVALYVGKDWDQVSERSGWVFFRKGNAYAAVRVVAAQADASRSGPLAPRGNDLLDGQSLVLRPDDKAWSWTGDKKAMQLVDKFSPIVIYAGSVAEHGSFDAFQTTVLKSRSELHATVVPGYFFLVFQAAQDAAREIRFPANAPDVPWIGGQPIDYQPGQLFAGPWIQSRYKSGHVVIQYGSRRLLLNF